VAEAGTPGRSCPPAYGYGARSLAAPAQFGADTLYVAGGLYGNVFALERLLEMFAAEPGDKALVFNGDFHWFDVAAVDFLRVSGTVLAHRATRGNVETELADPAAGAGCGCAYPEFVDDDVVARSNRIIERLRQTALGEPDTLARIAALPMHLVAEVGGARVGIVHGDADSLAGWGFSQEALATSEGARAARAAFARSAVRVFASSHSCLPVLQDLGEGRLVANNGAAGMPNFRGTGYGIATRVSTRPHPGALYCARSGALHVEALAIEYDGAAWQRRFLEQWSEGSDAHLSYFERIANGPRYELAQAVRAGLRRAA
jgi:hypothetical protein